MKKHNKEAFRKLSADKQIEHLKGTRSERVFTFQRDDINEDERTVWLSISSERPYERWWGIEVLDHDAGSIRTERLESGAPILVDHDRTDQVGVVERFEIGPDRKLRFLARFSRSARAEEIFQDVLDGIRKNTSVGYMINDLILEKQEGDQATYRVTDWEPFEGSIVSVPADPSVGIGRADEDNLQKLIEETHTMSEKKKEQTKADEVVKEATNPVDESAIAQREVQRVNEILSAGDEFKDFGGPELARELAKNPKSTVESFKAQMLEKMKGAQKPTETAQPAYFPSMNVEARYRFSPLKAFKDVTLENGQQMRGEESAYRAGQWLLANVYGNEKAAQWCKENGVGQRVMGGNSLSGGGAVIPTEMEQAVIDLRDTYGAARQLCKIRPMASDSLQIPRRDGGLTAYYFDDEDGSGITASDKSWGQVNLVAKKLGILARVSKDMVEDAVINVVDDLASEMAWAFAKSEDEAWIDGDGTSSYGGIQGLRTLFAGTAYASRLTLDSGVDTFAEMDNTDLTNMMAYVASYAKPGAVWLMSETAKSQIIDRIAGAAGGNTVQTISGAVVPTYLGHRIVTSEAMPSGAGTDYSSTVLAMFGRFDMASSLGARRGIQVEVLRERYAELGQLGIVATERFDIVNHDLGSTSVKGPVSAAYGN